MMNNNFDNKMFDGLPGDTASHLKGALDSLWKMVDDNLKKIEDPAIKKELGGILSDAINSEGDVNPQDLLNKIKDIASRS